MFKETDCICKLKRTVETMPDNYTFPYDNIKPFTYYETAMYSCVLGELKFQVSKEQYDKLIVGKTYTLSITEGN